MMLPMANDEAAIAARTPPSVAEPAPATRAAGLLPHLRYVIQAMRPRQWTKNGIVFLALVFSVNQEYEVGDPSTWIPKLFEALVAFAIFCIVCSADYLVNDILVKSDRMSMAHGLEVRSPFLDADLAEFALRLPAPLKAGRFGHGKRVLRALAEKTYGASLARAKKQGFSIPVHEWLRGPARPLVEDLLSAPSLARFPELNAPAIRDVVTAHAEGRRAYGWEIWGLMVLVAWHRQQIQHVPMVRSADVPQRVTFDH